MYVRIMCLSFCHLVQLLYGISLIQSFVHIGVHRNTFQQKDVWARALLTS